MTKKHVQISERALFQRVKRKLAQDGEALRTCRAESRGSDDLGRFYTVDIAENYVVRTDIDLEELGRELGVFKPWEKLTD